MLIVLAQRVLKRMAHLEDLLGPGILALRTENPALHVLGFYHENTVARNHDVIDLGGAIFCGQSDVVQYGVTVFGEKEFEEEGDLEFAPLAFEPWGSDKDGEDKDWDDVPEYTK